MLSKSLGLLKKEQLSGLFCAFFEDDLDAEKGANSLVLRLFWKPKTISISEYKIKLFHDLHNAV